MSKIKRSEESGYFEVKLNETLKAQVWIMYDVMKSTKKKAAVARHLFLPADEKTGRIIKELRFPDLIISGQPLNAKWGYNYIGGNTPLLSLRFGHTIYFWGKTKEEAIQIAEKETRDELQKLVERLNTKKPIKGGRKATLQKEQKMEKKKKGSNKVLTLKRNHR